jgi:hypothetical protein
VKPIAIRAAIYSTGQHSTASVDAAAAMRAAVPPPQGNISGVSTGPMHILFTGGQMLPVGQCAPVPSAQHQMLLQNVPTAQRMCMFHLQGQHANYLQQAAMGTLPRPCTAAGGNGAESGAHPSAPPAQESAPPQSWLEQQQKVLQAQLQQQEQQEKVLQEQLQQQQVDTIQSLHTPA